MTLAKVVRLGRRGQMVLPKEIREALGLAEGDSFVIVLQKEGRALIATPESYEQLTADLRRHAIIGLDTSMLVYHLEDVPTIRRSDPSGIHVAGPGGVCGGGIDGSPLGNPHIHNPTRIPYLFHQRRSIG